MTQDRISAELAGRLAAADQLSVQNAAEAIAAQRTAEAVAGLQLAAVNHFNSLLGRLSLPKPVELVAAEAYRTGDYSLLDQLQIDPLKHGMVIEGIDPFTGKPTQYSIEVDLTPGRPQHTLQPVSPDKTGPTLGDLRRELARMHAFSNSKRAATAEDPGWSDSGVGVNPSTGLGEFRAAEPSAEEWKQFAVAEVEHLLPQLDAATRAEVAREIAVDYDEPNKLSATAVVRRLVDGPEGELVVAYERMQWTSSQPYPKGDGVEVVTLRRLKELALQRAEAVLLHGRGPAELAVRAPFWRDAQQLGGAAPEALS